PLFDCTNTMDAQVAEYATIEAAAYCAAFAAIVFQAEDGIRHFHVTGVQTCALPIFPTGVEASTEPRAWATARLGRACGSGRSSLGRFTPSNGLSAQAPRFTPSV